MFDVTQVVQDAEYLEGMARRACCVVVVLSACFNPHFSPETLCSSERTCPDGFVCNLANLRCETPPLPGSSDAASPPGTDAQVCYGAAPFTLCLAAAPTAQLTIDTTNPANPFPPPETQLDTDTSPLCVPTASGGSGDCVVAATTITIKTALRATGSKPLVLVASESIMTVANGVIDVGSSRGDDFETGAGADYTACAPGLTPAGSSGGAGGSYLGTGGNGGDGRLGDTAGQPGAMVSSVTALRGGCPGQGGADLSAGTGGAPGHGGGAVLLIAGGSISLAGGIIAGGEGGAAGPNSGGGGGGGSGGMIALVASTITVTGPLVANGGGGGEGFGTATAPGLDAITIAAATGGSAGSPSENVKGGHGGNGSAGTAAGPGDSGLAGGGGVAGGGGGGGGAGIIIAIATSAAANLGTQVSPPATP